MPHRLGTIRSLTYFLPVIEEVLSNYASARTISSISATSSNASPQPGRPHRSPLAPSARMMENHPHAFGLDDIACP